MNRVVMAALVLLVLLVGLGIVLLSTGKARPAMPRDEAHLQRMDDKGCQTCHRYNAGVDPLPASHPVEKGCQSCHALAPEGA